MGKWWNAKISIKELREVARDWLDSSDEDKQKDGKELLALFKGERGNRKVNYLQAGGWNGDNNTQRILTNAGYEILTPEEERFTSLRLSGV